MSPLTVMPAKTKTPDDFEPDAQARPAATPADPITRVWNSPILRGTIGFGVLLFAAQTAWLAASPFPLWLKFICAALAILATLYFLVEAFGFTLALSFIVASAVLIFKAWSLATLKYDSSLLGSFAVIVFGIFALVYYFFDKTRQRCEKCGTILTDDHLFDDETASVYRCPNCKHINYHKFPALSPAHNPSHDDERTHTDR